MGPPTIVIPPPGGPWSPTKAAKMPLSPPPMASPRSGLFSGSALLAPYSPQRSTFSGSTLTENTLSTHNPFNFETRVYEPGSPPTKGDIGRRKGHRYARSSVSHQIILEPIPKTPLPLPVSLPVPTLKEFRTSMTTQQTTRWIWCFCHLAIAGYVQTCAHGSLSMTTLSHLLFFDALGAFLCVAVDVSRNFEVWNRSSISHPFGLERSEVLAGLATSIILLFMGLDLLSHGLTHALEHVGDHVPHHHSLLHDAYPTSGTVNVAALAAALCTIVSAALLGNHERIGRATELTIFESVLPATARNPSHFLPISLSAVLLLAQLLGFSVARRADALLGFAYAAGMVVLGARLCAGVGRMLLMSAPGNGDGVVRDVVRELGRDPAVVRVDEAKVWQVHYGLCMANFKVRAKGPGTGGGAAAAAARPGEIERLRERIASLVKSRLGGQYGLAGSKAARWEISTQITIER